ncbi:MAG TPA: glutathione S-transferase N-terminal domain-containing protein [Soehngenia sp.]|nr:glutathione S-transferase N-terminal domain-containing protein [Soehngenia sp.]HPP31428.1 glutathione S-transferase N-terminal domain-containing protein [Soehngenia sp.]
MDLKLYYMDYCPFCNRVINYIKENNLEIELRNINIKENYDELISKGGLDQVPMLLIDGKPLYESEDIIKFLNGILKKHDE